MTPWPKTASLWRPFYLWFERWSLQWGSTGSSFFNKQGGVVMWTDVWTVLTPADTSFQAVTELPSYIVECVLTIVFSLISHPQLSIRETVTKIMSTYMQHVESQVTEDFLVLVELGGSVAQSESTCSQKPNCTESSIVTTWIDDRYLLGFASVLRFFHRQILCRLYKSYSDASINWGPLYVYTCKRSLMHVKDL